MWKTTLNNSDQIDEQLARNQQERYAFIKEWAEYVRTHPDPESDEQVNKLVNSQSELGRHIEDERPNLDEIDSELLDS